MDDSKSVRPFWVFDAELQGWEMACRIQVATLPIRFTASFITKIYAFFFVQVPRQSRLDWSQWSRTLTRATAPPRVLRVVAALTRVLDICKPSTATCTRGLLSTVSNFLARLVAWRIKRSLASICLATCRSLWRGMIAQQMRQWMHHHVHDRCRSTTRARQRDARGQASRWDP